MRKKQRYCWDLKSAKDTWNAILLSSLRIHRQNCPFYNGFEREQLVGLNISYCGPFIAGAIKASVSMTHGAGGFSLSPNLTFYPVVPSNAPAFALLDFQFTHTTTVSDMQECFDMRTQQLSRLYSERGASPYDTDLNGNTVLHVCKTPACILLLLRVIQKACMIFRQRQGIPFCDRRIHIDTDTLEAYFRFLQGLRNLGVPLNRSNAEGR